MTVFCHELRQNRLSLLIWSAAISFMLGVCVLIYPEMSSQMGDISEMFADMGSFSAAFGMDQINFGEFIGYFGIECGNVLGLGGAFFAAILGVSALAKEEKDHTAEFLLTHPVSRTRIITQKLAAVMAQILILNLLVAAVTVGGCFLVGETAEMATVALLLLSYLLLQMEISAITFGVSAFIRRGGLGIGFGIAILFYFMNIIANLTGDLEFLKYLTPFGYTDSGYIIENGAMKMEYLAIGAAFAAIGIAAAFVRYRRKDIA